MGTPKDIWVFAENRDGKLAEVVLELLGEGRKLADQAKQQLVAVLLGHNIEHLSHELAEYGADVVYVGDNPLLEHYTCDAYALVLESLIKKNEPNIFLIGGTTLGMDLAPRVAIKVNTGLSAHCVTLDLDDKGLLVAKVPAFGGGLMASILCPQHHPQMATVSPGFLHKAERYTGRKAIIEKVPVKIPENKIRTKVIEVSRKRLAQGQPLEAADYIVAGGYGIGSKENWKVVEELAAVWNGRTGATRPACDEGWASLEEQMIGQSGKRVKPKLYIGVGISGVMHHLMGIMDAKVIVAINRDANAPLVKASDYAIIGDFREIVPRLIEEFKNYELA